MWWIIGAIVFIVIVAVTRCDGSSGGGSSGHW